MSWWWVESARVPGYGDGGAGILNSIHILPNTSVHIGCDELHRITKSVSCF